MSRSNAPANQPGAWPPQQRGAGEFDPNSRDNTGRPAARQPQAPAQNAYPVQNAYPAEPAYYPPQANPQAGYGNPAAYGRPAPAQPQRQDAYYQQPAYQQPAPAAPAPQGARAAAQSYAPQFDPYIPPAPQQPTYAEPASHLGAYPAAPRYDAVQPAAPAYGAAPQARPADSAGLSQLDAARAQLAQGRQAPAPYPRTAATDAQANYDAWRQASAAQAQPAQHNPHGFDLGEYLPQGDPSAAANARRLGATPDLNFGEWPRGAQAGAEREPGFDQEPQFATEFAHEGAYQQAAYDAAAAEAGEPGQDVEEDEHYDYEEPKRRSSLVMVAGALVAAVVVGSGLAFVYQKFVAGNGTLVATPLIRSDGTPAKTKPAEPGGKQFGYSDSKIMGRLSENGTAITTASTTAPADADPAAPRKVATIPVGRDGTLAAPPPSAAEPAAAAAPPSVAVPGLTIVDGFGGRPPARPAAQAAAAPAQPVIVTPPPAAVKPIVTAKAQPPAEPDLSLAAPAEAAAPAAAPAAPKKPVAPKKKPVDAYGASGGTVPAGSGAAVPAAAPAATGASGYVAVLASVPASPKSRMDALKQFADMQQKYAGVLSDRTPDVQEANLGEKGVYHRLMAGPPGSREQASSVCGQLKAAGYTGCWVTAY